MLRLVETNKPHTTDFSEIPCGALFKYNDSVYIALNENDDLCLFEDDGTYNGKRAATEHYGVNLETGELVWFEYTDEVIPIDGTLTYERI